MTRGSGSGRHRGGFRKTPARCAATLAVLLAAGAAAHAGADPQPGEPSWMLEGFAGAAYNVQTELRIEQHGQDQIELAARYETRPFESPIYYALRIGRAKGGRAWEGELIHHKLYLMNPPDEVQYFSVSHGYNLLFLNRAWERHGTDLRAGAGVVIVHPENGVRGLELATGGGTFGGGYSLTGPALQGCVGRRFVIGRGAFFALEGKITLAYARVSVTQGEAAVPSLAVHALAGFGYRFGG